MSASSADLPVLTLRLFGALEAHCGATPLSGLHLREGERLLAYLALHPGVAVPYRTLARLFWPSEARHSDMDSGDFPITRQAVRSLRLALGSEAHRLARSGKGTIVLDLAGAKVDVLEFDRLVQQEDASSWEQAVALYRGPLLEGWPEAWAQETRARKRRSFERVVKGLIEHALAQNREEDAIAWIRHAVAVTPGEETWWRELLRAFARQRRYDKMEAAFDSLRLERSEKELEIETRDLIAQLRQEAETALPLLPVSVSVDPGGALTADQPSLPVPKKASAGPRQQVTLLYKRHAEPDEAVMQLLERELTAAGYAIFTDQHLRSGVAWAKEIERQVRESYAVIPLLSRAAIGSEMLEYEIEVAHNTAQRRGLPLLLPVRIEFEDPLPTPSVLSDILSPLQYTLWKGTRDDGHVVASLVRSLREPPRIESEIPPLEPAGGALSVDSPFYIERPTDATFHQAIRNRHSIVLVKGARQMGKTSLLARGLQQARQQGIKVVRTDLQKLNQAQITSPDALYFALATALARQLGIAPPSRADWDPEVGANMNLEMFLFYQVLNAFPETLVWGLDEVDRLFSSPFGSEVFGLFRSWHNERSLDPTGPCSRLTLAIAYATEAHLFITDVNQSPFNVGTRLALNDFTVNEVRELNRRYGEPLRNEDGLTRFYRLMNGQPYLTRRGFDDMVGNRVDLTTLESLGDRDEGPFGDHLRRILAILIQDVELTEIVRGILHGQACPTPESFYRLRSAGILAGEWGLNVDFRCPIYAAYLARHL